MSRTWAEIVAIMESRRSANSLLLEKMLQVRNRYDGDIVIPLPEMDSEGSSSPMTPALVAETIDNHALRAASVRPIISCPPLDPLKDTGVRSKEFAGIRTRTLHATLFASKYNLLLRRTYRHLTGYATACFVVVPDYRLNMPRLEVRNPLGVYPEPKANEDLTPVGDCGFIYERSASWLRTTFPACRRELGGPIGSPTEEQELWDVVEWIDEDDCVYGLLGPRDAWSASARDTIQQGSIPSMELARFVNKTGRCTVVSMPRVTLNRIASNVANQLGTMDLMSKIMALSIAAEERAIFPDRFVIARPGEAPRILSNGGNWGDGRTGVTNLLDGVANVGQLDSAPPRSTLQTIDLLERNYRISTGLVPQMGGESYGALRTGRGMDSLMQASVDPRVQELQEIVEHGMIHANALILDQWKACFSGQKHVLFSGWGGSADIVELEPERHIESNHNVCSYAIAGADIQGVTIQLGQLLGANAISLRTFRAKHPWVEDPETESGLVDEEALERAAMESIMQKATSGQMPLIMLAFIEKHRREGHDIFDAIEKADAEMRALQAQQAPEVPVAPEGQPPLGAAPAMMPGLEGPPQPLAPSPEAPIGPSEGQVGLSSLVSALKAG